MAACSKINARENARGRTQSVRTFELLSQFPIELLFPCKLLPFRTNRIGSIFTVDIRMLLLWSEFVYAPFVLCVWGTWMSIRRLDWYLRCILLLAFVWIAHTWVFMRESNSSLNLCAAPRAARRHLTFYNTTVWGQLLNYTRALHVDDDCRTAQFLWNAQIVNQHDNNKLIWIATKQKTANNVTAQNIYILIHTRAHEHKFTQYTMWRKRNSVMAYHSQCHTIDFVLIFSFVLSKWWMTF